MLVRGRLREGVGAPDERTPRPDWSRRSRLLGEEGDSSSMSWAITGEKKEVIF